MTATFPCIEVSGTHREMGRQHGTQARERIRGYLDNLAESLKLSRTALQKRALKFQPLFDKTCPHLVEEVTGLGEGAGLTFAEALALQLRGELGQLPPEGCTTFVISGRGTASGQILIGQNSDTPAETENFAYVLRATPIDKPAFLIWTFGGMLGYHGLNSHGVAHFANALGGGPAWKFALSHYPVKRMMLEQRTIGDVVDLLRKLPVCSNGNYVLSDGSGEILDVELTSDGPFLLGDEGEGFIAHSNHYVCAAHACQANFDVSLPDSFPRLDRMRAMIREKFGSITVDDVKGFLSDHAHYPVGICRHPNSGPGDAILPSTGKTVSAMIAEPATGKFHVACGNPCERPFTTYTL